MLLILIHSRFLNPKSVSTPYSNTRDPYYKYDTIFICTGWRCIIFVQE